MLVPAEGGAPQQEEFSGAGREEPALVHSPGSEHLLEHPRDEVPPGFGEAPPQPPRPSPHTLPIPSHFPADFQIPPWACSKAMSTGSPDPPLLQLSSVLTLTLRQLMLS